MQVAIGRFTGCKIPSYLLFCKQSCPNWKMFPMEIQVCFQKKPTSGDRFMILALPVPILCGVLQEQHDFSAVNLPTPSNFRSSGSSLEHQICMFVCHDQHWFIVHIPRQAVPCRTSPETHPFWHSAAWRSAPCP